MTLGEKVRTLRLQRGMTQKELAGEHITRNMLSQIENGLAAPSMKTLEYLAAALQVTVGTLMGESTANELSGAKQALAAGKAEEARELALGANADPDEKNLLLAQICSKLATDAFIEERFPEARAFANQALEHETNGYYHIAELHNHLLSLLVRCDLAEKITAEQSMMAYREFYDACAWEGENHLLGAVYHMANGHISAAERELWMVTTLTEQNRPAFLILRGRLALMQEKYGNAISFLQQAESLGTTVKSLRRELYGLMELAYKELEDYKSAYEYAAKQREL